MFVDFIFLFVSAGSVALLFFLSRSHVEPRGRANRVNFRLGVTSRKETVAGPSGKLLLFKIKACVFMFSFLKFKYTSIRMKWVMGTNIATTHMQITGVINGNAYI